MPSWNQIQDGITIFMGIFIQALPYILLGVILSIVISFFVKDDKLLKMLPKSKVGKILFANTLGFLFPVCECGNIPVARRLIKKGVPSFVAITFLLSAPVLNPVVIFATYSAFKNQPEILYGRFLFTFIIAGLIGFFFSFAKDQKSLVLDSVLEVKSHDGHSRHSHSHTKMSKITSFVNNVKTEFIEMAGVLSIGAFIASLVQVIMPRAAIIGLGEGPVSSVLAMSLVAFITSICSTVDSFFALGFVNNFTPMSILAFLVLGPMLDIKALIMLKTTFTTKTVFFIGVLTSLSTLVFALFLNLNWS